MTGSRGRDPRRHAQPVGDGVSETGAAAQAEAIGMPADLRNQIILGDQVGFLVAVVTLVLLATRNDLAKPLAWVLVAATAIDLGNALIGGIGANLLGRTLDLSWLILTFYVPVLWGSIALIAWLLVTRGRERIATDAAAGTTG